MSAPSIYRYIFNWFFLFFYQKKLVIWIIFWQISRHTKCVMDVFNIPYNNIEVNLIVYTTMSMIYKEAFWNLVPFQMAQFLIKFKITNTSIWFDLTFEQAKQLLENLYNNNDANIKINSIIAMTNNISAVKASLSMSITTLKIIN